MTEETIDADREARIAADLKAADNLDKFAAYFTKAAEGLRRLDAAETLWVVVVPPEGQPTCVRCENADQLAEAVLKYRGDEDAHAFVFRGERLPIVKGRWYWQVGEGKDAIPLTAGVPVPVGGTENAPVAEDGNLA
jgi:hypothetical protein